MTTTGPLETAPRGSDIRDVLSSEGWKFITVPSTRWTLLAAVASNVVVAGLVGAFVPGRLSASQAATVDVVRLSLGGIHLSQVAIGVLGVLVIGSEYGTGTIRASLTAVPRRRTMLAAKASVFAVIAGLVATASSAAAFLTYNAFGSGSTMTATFGDPGVLRAVVGGGLYLTAVGLLGLGLGALLRSSAGAITALLGLLFVPPLLSSLLPPSWREEVTPYVPMEAGSQIFVALGHDPGSLGPLAGLAVLGAYVALALVAGFVTIGRRDA